MIGYLIFASDIHKSMEMPSLDGDYSISLWRPSLQRMVHPSLSLTFGVWSLFHYLRIFKNDNYSVLFVMYNGTVVHRSFIIPAYRRWPFMDRDDLQVSSTWTHPEFHGRGLATFALRMTMYLLKTPKRRFWYVTRVENTPSIAVAIKSGLKLIAVGKRTSWAGLRILGQLVISNYIQW